MPSLHLPLLPFPASCLALPVARVLLPEHKNADCDL